MTALNNRGGASSYRKLRRKFASYQVTLGLLLLFIVVSIWEPETSPSSALPLGSTNKIVKEVSLADDGTLLLAASTAKNKVIYVGKYGLGHRLGKMAGAFHVAQKLQIHLQEPLSMEVQWGVCQDGDRKEDKGGKIFDYLFGSNPLWIGTDVAGNTEKTALMSSATTRPLKLLWIRNDCHGYYTGQSYKNIRQPIPKHYLIDDDPSKSPWFQKMDSDAKLFRMLLKRFLKLHPEPIEFMQTHKFEQHTVLGLHIRTGNGETEHFISSNRAVLNEQEFIRNVMGLLGKFLNVMETSEKSKPPLLFLATDTPSVIPLVQDAAHAWNIPVLTFPQPQLPPSAGVTYSSMKVGQPCLLAWKAMMADTVLLSHADVLIAGMRSSFTQIVPMSMVLNGGIKPPAPIKVSSSSIEPRFCEVSTTGTAMSCVQDRQAWMVRNTTNQWTLSSSNHINIPDTTSEEVSTPVIHKVVVHFPDVDGDVEARLEQSRSFFQEETHQDKQQANLEESSSMSWGDKLIDLKYRQRLKGVEDVPTWTTT